MKDQFPIFTHHPSLIYLDNAATVQKPQYVLDEVHYFLTHEYANIHRGTYPLSLAAEEQWDCARRVVAEVIGGKTEEVVFTSNATHSSNLIAHGCLLSGRIKAGDIIAVGLFDHHASLAPWQLIAERVGARIIYVGYDQENRQYDWSVFDNIDMNRLKIVSLSLVSNVTGQILALDFVKELSKKCQMYFVVDASQALPHFLIDVSEMGADFLFFTGHKLGALTGIGVLRGKKEHLSHLQPVFVGGGAIDKVTVSGHTYQQAPDKFEPGTPNVMGAVSLRAAFERIASLGNVSVGSFREKLMGGYSVLQSQENDLVSNCCNEFSELQNAGVLQVIGSVDPMHRISVFSRLLSSGNVNKLGWYLGEQNICIRTGAHCTHPFHTTLGIESTARMSLWVYNNMSDLQMFFANLRLFITK